MGTPKNNKNLKTPLSTIKKGPIKGLRNILTNPQEFLWPIVKDERGEDLKNLLNQLLPSKGDNLREISWAQLKKMSKEERSALKQKNQFKRMENKDNGIMNGICLGINAVTRALEKDTLVAVVIDSNVDPMIMIKHVVIMCQNNNIPVILVSFLKDCTLKRLGFASSALGLNVKALSQSLQLHKSSMDEKTSIFHKLHEKILNLAEEFPKTTNPIQLFDHEEDSGKETETISLETSKQQAKPLELSTSVYSNRESIKQRVFIPPQSQNIQINQDTSRSEFISFGDDLDIGVFNERAHQISKMKRYTDINELKPKKKLKMEIDNTNKETIYCPLKVKRVQGNPQRLKATKTPKMKKKLSGEKK